MIRRAFVLAVHPGCEAEYEHRHNPIWPELEVVLRHHGVLTYTIFLHPETRQLFGYVECQDAEQWEAIARDPVCRRWWAYMRDLMPTHADDSPVSIPLREVFHLPPERHTPPSSNRVPGSA